MKKSLCLFLVSCLSFPLLAMDASMYQWQSHYAYGSVNTIVETEFQIFGLSGGALYSVDKTTEAIQTYSKQGGLNGGEIATMAYDEQSKTLILAYADGLIDLLHNGQFIAMTDLQQKSLMSSKRTNKIVVDKGIAYFCLPFGIMAVDIKKRQVKDTYYIGQDGAEVNVLDLAYSADSLYAISSSELYSAARTSNLLDFASWNASEPLPSDSTYQALAYWQNHVVVVAKNTLLWRNGNTWESPCPECFFSGLCPSANRLFLLTSGNGIYYLDTIFKIQMIASSYEPLSIALSGPCYWMGTKQDGIVRQTSTETQSFSVNGPLVNLPYRMRFNQEKMVMVPGGYYVGSTGQDGCLMIMDNGNWSGITTSEIRTVKDKGRITNFCDAIIDPRDPNHYYVASLGAGLIEFVNNQPYKWYYSENSFLDNIAVPAENYTWVDGFAYDSKNNLWMINVAGQRNIKVLMADGQWVALDHSAANQMSRARDLLIWNQNENIKIITVNHTTCGLVILDDKGTISNQSDDKCIFRSEFVDQDNNRILIGSLYSIAQDKKGALWIGTNAGLIVVDDPTALFQNNTCRKIKIPRNDGTGLADYLLGTEQINALVVDGANRKWIGTATSGLYLVSEDGLETISHFTTENSPLIDNSIISIAIQPTTGRVFVGTDKGLMSYQNDAAPAQEDYSGIYSYPNPVRPDYEGVITIRGLMDETTVHIVDESGNLVCETRSNGGLAIWDGKTADGRRAASGVYTVFVNETSDGSHAVTKILLMH